MSENRAGAGLDDAYKEFMSWFSDEYMPAFIEAVGGGSDPSFISDFWGSPLWVGNDLGPVTLAETDEDVVRAFTAMTTRLHAAGYADSVVLDRRTVIFNKDGAAVDSLWSRRRGDGSEIERTAVHFALARRADGIRIVTFETHATDAQSLAEVWPVING
ncbi:hypothetical protein ACQYWQ_27615 [Streptomyces sp. P6-2-1]|uniref:DUF6841 family protein n=1 Tax=unclassified Streptomyces TaxID=2593676 RepID=UPI003D36D9E3